MLVLAQQSFDEGLDGLRLIAFGREMRRELEAFAHGCFVACTQSSDDGHGRRARQQAGRYGELRMRSFALRLLRVTFFAIAAWLLFQLLDPMGLGWVVLLAFCVLAMIWLGYRFVRARQRQALDVQADRWAEALMSPPERPAAIRELREAIAKNAPASEKRAVTHAQLSLVLAELLEADGEPQAAMEVLDAIAVEDLPMRTAAMVRHARAVAALSAGDTERASKILAQLHASTGDRAVDLRVRLLRGLVAVEKGEGEKALALADECRVAAGDDPDLRVEARVLKALALDALGERDDALKVMRAIGREMLEVLLVLGLPRVRLLAEAALPDED